MTRAQCDSGGRGSPRSTSRTSTAGARLWARTSECTARGKFRPGPGNIRQLSMRLAFPRWSRLHVERQGARARQSGDRRAAPRRSSPRTGNDLGHGAWCYPEGRVQWSAARAAAAAPGTTIASSVESRSRRDEPPSPSSPGQGPPAATPPPAGPPPANMAGRQQRVLSPMGSTSRHSN